MCSGFLFFMKFSHRNSLLVQVLVAARAEVWLCCRSFAGIAGSNPAGGMSVSTECGVSNECDREAP
jgi:hypothetical protein